MNILIVHEVSYRKKVVYEYQDFAERLAARGHKVHVIDFDDTGDLCHQKEPCSRTGIGTVTLENTPGIALPIIKYITARWNHQRILELKLQNKEIDVVFLYSVFINGTNTVRLCHKYNIPVVYRVLDVYHQLRQNPLIKYPLYFGEKYIYRNADVICLTNEKMQKYVEKMTTPRHPLATTIIHHGVDTKYFKPTDPDAGLMKKFNIRPDDEIVLFLGTTYSFSGLDTILENFHLLLTRRQKAKLVIVGGGDLDPKISELVHEKKLEDRVLLTGFRPYDEIPGWLSIASVTINSFHINSITRDVVPIKILQYLAAGKPLVCTKMPDVMRLFPENKSGVHYCDITDPPAFIQTIGDLLENTSQREELAKNGLNHIRLHFSIEATIDKLESLLHSVSSK